MLPTDPIEQARDVARALALAQSKAAEWGADRSRFMLMGHSAGAHLVALVSADPRKAYDLGARPWLGSVLLDSAVLDVEAVMRGRHLPLYDRAFGRDPRYWRAASPERQLTSAAPPMLLACSLERRDDPCTTASRFSERAASLNVRTSVLRLQLSHAEVNGDLGVPGAYTDAVEAFLRSLGQPASAR
jgi:arylformamidase